MKNVSFLSSSILKWLHKNSPILMTFLFLKNFLFIFKIYLFGCIGSLLLCVGFSLVAASGASVVAEHGFSARGLQ